MAVTGSIRHTRRQALHYLAGARVGDLARSLTEHGPVALAHAPRIALWFAAGILRLPFYSAESVRVRLTGLPDTRSMRPLFIVGHWRSGTTLLHNLLAADPQFAAPTMADVARPFEFLPGPFEPISRAFLRASLPPTRLGDDLALREDLPEEEELALAGMAMPSAFNCLYFPARFDEIVEREICFEGPEGSLAAKRWRSGYAYFIGKLQLKHPRRRLLLKNPANCARIGELLALFPEARFVHIHRHPEAVLSSCRRFFPPVIAALALQDYDQDAVLAAIVSRYPRTMLRLLDGLSGLAPGRVATVSLNALLEAPMQEIGRIYRELGIDGFGAAQEPLRVAVARFIAARRPVAASVPDGTVLPDEAIPVARRLGYAVQGRGEPP